MWKLLCLILSVLLLSCQACVPSTIYVSTSGADSNDGSQQNPLSSITKAITLIDSGVACDDSKIIVSGGSYIVQSTTGKSFTVIASDATSAYNIKLAQRGGISTWTGFNFSSASLVDATATFYDSIFTGSITYNLQANTSSIFVSSCLITRNAGGIKLFKSDITAHASVFSFNNNVGALVSIDSATSFEESLSPLTFSTHTTVIDNCIFVNNTNNLSQNCAWQTRFVPCGGGAIYVRGGLLAISNSVLNTNSVPYVASIWNAVNSQKWPIASGGAIFGSNLLNISIYNTSFIQNSVNFPLGGVQGYGSAILFNVVGQVSLEQCKFENNYLASNTKSSMIEIVLALDFNVPELSGNYTDYPFAMKSSSVSGFSGTALLNIAGGSGADPILLYNTSFSDVNSISYQLVGLNNVGELVMQRLKCSNLILSSLLVLSSSFFASETPIYMYDSIHENSVVATDYLSLPTPFFYSENNTYSNITAAHVWAYTTEAVVANLINETFIGNTVTSVVGAADAIHVLIQDCKFIGNILADSAVNVQRSYLTVNNSLFDSNVGVNGAAINFLYDMESIDNITVGVVVFNSKFTNNTATQNGGAIYIEDQLDSEGIVIAGCYFSGNKARVGGAIYALDTNMTDLGSTFTRNTATGNGGAVYIYNHYKESYTASFFNSTFSFNAASKTAGNGGSVYIQTFEVESYVNQSSFVFSRCNFFNSTSFNGGDVAQVTTTIEDVPSLVLYDTCSFSGSSATTGGSVYSNRGFYTTIKNSRFDFCSAGNQAGCIYQYESTIDIENTVFSNAKAYIEGGAILVQITAANVTVGDWRNVTFLNNEAELTKGGAVSLSTGVNAKLNMASCHFANNHASFYGGAINANGYSSVTMMSSTFTSNSAFQGGAILMDDNAVISAQSVTFELNSAEDIGGAVAMLKSSKSTIRHVIFKSNAATSQGGAVLAGASSTSVFVDCYFQENSVSSGQGGALSASSTVDGYPSLTNCHFENNTATIAGAAYVLGTASPVFTKTTFIGNQASTDAGAVYTTSNSAATFDNCTFQENVASNQGGAVKITTTVVGYPIFNNTYFGLNNATIGGAVYINSQSPLFTGCVFDSNSASNEGGAAHLAGVSHPQFLKTQFLHNFAVNYGGAISSTVVGTTGPKVQSSSFTNNNSTSGGAIAALTALFGVYSSNFTMNTAAQFGGAIFVVPNSIFISNCSFVSNSAVFGGAIQFQSGLSTSVGVFNGNYFGDCSASSAGGVFFWDYPAGASSETISKISPVCTDCVYDESNSATGYGALFATRPYAQQFANSTVTSLTVKNNVIGPINIHVYDLYGQYATKSYQLFTATVALRDSESAQIYGDTKVTSYNGEFIFNAININGYFGDTHTLIFSLASSEGSVPPLFLNVTMGDCTVGEESYVTAASPFQFCRACAAGYYNLNGNGSCIACPADASCNGGYQVKADDDYWIMSDDLGVASTYHCPTDFCVDGGCAERRVGLLCGECIDGYQNLNGACIQCDDSDPASLFGTLVLLWVYVAFLQMTNRELEMDKTPDSKQKYVVSGLTKIIVFYVQTVSLIGTPQENIRKIFSFLSFQFFLGIAGKCSLKVSFYQDFLISILIPVILFVLLAANFVLHCIALAVTKNLYGATSKIVAFLKMDYNLYVKTFCALLLFSYTSVTTAVFTFMNCRTVGPYSVVASAPTIMCDSDEYHSWSALAYFLLAAYVVLLPVALFSFLLYNHLKGNLNKEIYAARMGILFQCFKDRYFFWDVIILLRRLIFVIIYVVAYQYADVQGLTIFCFSFFILTTHVLCQPYRSKAENRIETGLLSCLTIIAGIESSEASVLHATDISIFSSVITFLAAIPIVIGLYKLLLDFLFRVGLITTRKGSKIIMVFGVDTDDYAARKFST